MPYRLNHANKTATQCYPDDGDLLGFLQLYFNPIVLLIDRERAENAYTLKVDTRDEWYTYLTLKSKEPKSKPWLAIKFSACHLALLNKATAAIPKDMPRQLRIDTPNERLLFDIKSWRINPPDPLKEADFARPATRPGWKVISRDESQKK